MRTYLYLGGLFLLLACSPARFVEPLEKGKWALGASLGGPVLDFEGLPVPTPITSVEAGYGLDSSLTIHGALHTSAALFGNAQVDLGLTYRLRKQQAWYPAVSASASLNTIYDFDDRSAKLWPIVDLNAYWHYGSRENYWYLGVNNYFELSPTMANDQAQKHHWIFNPQLGHILKGKRGGWEFLAELKFLAPNVRNTYAFIPYKSLTGQFGASGIYIGFRKLLGKK
ncbi:MAG: hypothetical protein EP338_10225 [Bacteroidetes bacterium]|nr:MAG: hypothetical protein EP338_10225 [Bacteroidota bacterium]